MMQFRIRSTVLQIQFGFLAIPAFIFALGGETQLLPALLACAVHETGHIAAAKICGARITSIRFGALGIHMQGNLNGLSCLRQTAVSLAGPLANLLGVALLLPFPKVFYAMQLCLFVFHILPAVPLDGGAALYSALCSVLPQQTAARWCTGISVIFALLLGTLGFSVLLQSKGNFTLLAAAVYILLYVVLKQRDNLA